MQRIGAVAEYFFQHARLRLIVERRTGAVCVDVHAAARLDTRSLTASSTARAEAVASGSGAVIWYASLVQP